METCETRPKLWAVRQVLYVSAYLIRNNFLRVMEDTTVVRIRVWYQSICCTSNSLITFDYRGGTQCYQLSLLI